MNLGVRHSQECTLGLACQQLFLTPLPSPPRFPWESLEPGLWQVRGVLDSPLTSCGSELGCLPVLLENPLKVVCFERKGSCECLQRVCEALLVLSFPCGHSAPCPSLCSSPAGSGDQEMGHCWPEGTVPGDLEGCSRRKLDLWCCHLVVCHKVNMSSHGTCLEIWVPLDMNRKRFIDFTSHRINTPTGFWGEGNPNRPRASVWTVGLCLS